MQNKNPAHKLGTPFQILSLSGGGIRGLYSIQVLAALEESLAEQAKDPNYWIGQHFDLICGTSIGGILALGLASGKTARELLAILDEKRMQIFPPKTFSSRLKKLNILAGTLYKEEPLQEVLESVFDEMLVGELKTRVIVPSVCFTTGKVQVFKTPHLEAYQKDHLLKVSDIARATSAAPTYFPIFRLKTKWYVDGGLAANSPSLMAFHETVNLMKIPREDIRLMHIGTMGSEHTADQSKKRDAGYWKMWGTGSNLIELTLSANETLHNQITSHLLDKEQMLFIDEKPGSDQEACLALDNASNVAADVLKGRGEDSAQYAINNSIYKEIILNKAPPPHFFYGPNAI